jgi:hypothetical protein
MSEEDVPHSPDELIARGDREGRTPSIQEIWDAGIRSHRAMNADGAMEMRLCETERIVLQPYRLYTFTVDGNCPSCVRMAARYGVTPPPAPHPNVFAAELELLGAILRGYPKSIARADAMRALARINQYLGK